MQFYVNTA